jgi:ribosomal protein S18 acetylase RimI-like enzyme
MLETRIATIADAAIISDHRRDMFADMGTGKKSDLELMRRACEPWIARMIAEEKYYGCITTDNNVPIASAGLMILDWPPHPLDPTSEHRGYLLNVFVHREYRKRGLAANLVSQCLHEAARRGIRVVTLHASDAGRPLYEKFGFTTTNEMRYSEQDSGGTTV